MCQKELLLPFSCKRRGFCPSCASRLYDPDRGASGRVRRAPGNDAPMGRVGPDALAVLDGVFTGPDRDRLALGLALVGLLGPLLIILMGVFVMGIVFAMLLPIFELNQLIR